MKRIYRLERTAAQYAYRCARIINLRAKEGQGLPSYGNYGWCHYCRLFSCPVFYVIR